jgi:hypothetical protein
LKVFDVVSFAIKIRMLVSKLLHLLFRS